MSDEDDFYPGRTNEELLGAHTALAHALEATSPMEFIERSRAIPKWYFAEHPKRAEHAAQLLPLCIEQLTKMAGEGDEEAASFLFEQLAEHPYLQTLLIGRRPPDSN